MKQCCLVRKKLVFIAPHDDCQWAFPCVHCGSRAKDIYYVFLTMALLDALSFRSIWAAQCWLFANCWSAARDKFWICAIGRKITEHLISSDATGAHPTLPQSTTFTGTEANALIYLWVFHRSVRFW